MLSFAVSLQTNVVLVSDNDTWKKTFLKLLTLSFSLSKYIQEPSELTETVLILGGNKTLNI